MKTEPMRFDIVAPCTTEHDVTTLRLREWIASDEQLGRAVHLEVGESLRADGPDGQPVGIVRVA